MSNRETCCFTVLLHCLPFPFLLVFTVWQVLDYLKTHCFSWTVFMYMTGFPLILWVFKCEVLLWISITVFWRRLLKTMFLNAFPQTTHHTSTAAPTLVQVATHCLNQNYVCFAHQYKSGIFFFLPSASTPSNILLKARTSSLFSCLFFLTRKCLRLWVKTAYQLFLFC